MHEFIKKYATSFEPKEAIRLIHKKVEKAEELCKESDKKYLDHLATAHDMIIDYFLTKGVDIRTQERA